MDTLSESEREALHIIESVWYEKRRFAVESELPSRFDLKRALNREVFKKALFERGIAPPRKRKASRKMPELSEEQMAAIVAVTNFADKRSIRAKLADMGISLTQWSGWMRQVKFKETLTTLSAENFEDALHHAHTGIMTAVDRGDINAIKLYLELSGRQESSDPTLKNFKLVVSRIVEALQFRLREYPEIMGQLHNDLEVIFDGRQPDYAIKGIAEII